jgi:hypothetical protein
MKIVKIVVTDEKGVEHMFEGTEGFCRSNGTNDGAMKPKEWTTVTAHLRLKRK